jgi:phage shock protein C
MFCTSCGIELKNDDKFCNQCGAPTGRGTSARHAAERLSRPMAEKKIAGVCAGFARYFHVDVTLVRVIWLVLTVWPVPVFGVVAYIVAWIVMPKDPTPAAIEQMHPANEMH